MSEKAYLTTRKDSDLKKSDSANKWIVLSGVLTLITIALILTFLGGDNVSDGQTESTKFYTFEGDCEVFDSCEAVEIVSAVIEEWDQKFDCGRDITIGTIENQPLNGGLKLDESSPGQVGLLGESYPTEGIRHTVAHALVHSCQPDEYTPLAEQFDMFGFHFIGTRGLKLVSNQIDQEGRSLNLNYLEEAFAELLATEIGPNRDHVTENYQNLYVLAVEIWQERDQKEYPDIAIIQDWVRTNDPTSLMAMIIDVDPDEIIWCDWHGVIARFTEVDEGLISPQEALEQIFWYRDQPDRASLCPAQ